MLRYATAFCLLAAPSPLMAQDKTDLCHTTGAITKAAVVARVDGLNAPDTTQSIIQSLPNDKDGFKPAVSPIVDWVYTLPKDQLDDDTVSKAYVAACLGQ